MMNKGLVVVVAGLVSLAAPPNPLQNNDITKILYVNPRTSEEYVASRGVFAIKDVPAAGHAGEECRLRFGENWAGFYCHSKGKRTVTYVAEGSIVKGKVLWQPQGTPLDYMAGMQVGKEY